MALVVVCWCCWFLEGELMTLLLDSVILLSSVAVLLYDLLLLRMALKWFGFLDETSPFFSDASWDDFEEMLAIFTR